MWGKGEQSQQGTTMVRCFRQNAASAVPGRRVCGHLGKAIGQSTREVFPEKSIPSGTSFRACPHPKEEHFWESSHIPFCCICSCISHPASLTYSHLPKATSISPHTLSLPPIHWEVRSPGSNLTCPGHTG